MTTATLRRNLHFIVSCATCLLGTSHLTAADEQIDFAQVIRPILSEHCFSCHGPDEAAREADLRLDTAEGLFTDLGGYAPVVAGEPESSALVERILADDPDERMPPASSNKTLSNDQKELLVQWIRQGATWRQHWSFARPRQSQLPDVQDEDWCRTEIDRFILSKLEDASLSPSPMAEPYTLVRRLYLDLIGLPPQSDEADVWVDKIWPGYSTAQHTNLSPKTESELSSAAENTVAINETAYQELVSHLLNSPHYGERWARRWLDLARYADTNGYEKDRDRSIWPYRDWVVQALNQDMPFDKFTIEQLAGDMLPDATQSQKIATGFHRNTMLNEEGGIDPLEFRFHAMTDRVATTGTTWLGLTLGCCQCHTHKYDPITHSEYYAVMGLLNNADEPYLELPDPEILATWERNRARAEELLQQLPELWPLPTEIASQAPFATQQPTTTETERPQTEGSSTVADPPNAPLSDPTAARRMAFDAAFNRWIETEQANAREWIHLRPTQADSNLPILTIQADDSIFASGDTAKRDDYTLEFAASDIPITALRLEALPDDRLPARGPGTTYYEGTIGDFYLTEVVASVQGQPIEFASASETYAKNRYGKNPVSAELSIDGDVQTGWSVHERQGERHVAVYNLKEPVPAGATLKIQMTFGRHFASSLGRFRWSACNASGEPLQARDYSDDLASILVRDKTTWTAAEQAAVKERFLMTASELSEHSDRIRSLRARPELPSTLVLAERPSQHPRPTYRHHRGEYLQPAEEVQPGLPAVLAANASHGPQDRLSFAQWLVSTENPLTARVVVNRHWAALFGTGLVKTVDDFGLQGESPSHPELLDWLAVEFMQVDRWSLKRLQRRIVSSAVYRQSSRIREQSAVIDPENRLLSYAPRFRLEAEILRDSLLVASGKLSRAMGGPPVKPPQPKGVTEVAYGSPNWDSSSGGDRYRRSLYTFVKRTAPFAMYATFDAPSGESCIAVRSRSNSPLQALTLLNDIMLVELAQATGERFAPQAGDENADNDPNHAATQSVEQLFRAVLVRPPRPLELSMLSQFIASQRNAFAAQPQMAKQLLGRKTNDKSLGEAELAEQAAWTAAARALFALDETQTRN